MKWLRFILSHSLFISFCAVALCFQTHLLLQVDPEPLVYLLVFSATLSGYNLYWLISKYHFSDLKFVAFALKNLSNFFVLGIGAVLTFYSLLMLPYLVTPFIVGMVLTLLYSLPLWPVGFALPLRRLGFLKTVLLSVTWTYITVMLPVEGNPVRDVELIYLILARFFFMLMLCAIFDSRDIAIDKMNQLRSLATDLSPLQLRVIMIVTFLLFMVSGFLLRLTTGGDQQLFAFLLTGLATFIVYLLSLKKRAYFFYYFVVDGLMLFSSALTFVASIG